MDVRKHYGRKHPVRFRPLPPRLPARRRASATEGGHRANLSERVEDVRILCRELSFRIAALERWLNALYNVSQAVRDKRVLRDIVTALSLLEIHDQPEELNAVPSERDRSHRTNA